MVHHATPQRLKIHPEIIDRLLIVDSILVSARAVNYAQEICQVGCVPKKSSTQLHALERERVVSIFFLGLGAGSLSTGVSHVVR